MPKGKSKIDKANTRSNMSYKEILLKLIESILSKLRRGESSLANAEIIQLYHILPPQVSSSLKPLYEQTLKNVQHATYLDFWKYRKQREKYSIELFTKIVDELNRQGLLISDKKF